MARLQTLCVRWQGFLFGLRANTPASRGATRCPNFYYVGCKYSPHPVKKEVMPTLPWMMAPPYAAAHPTMRGMVAFPLPGGDQGVAKTMDLIRSLVDQAIKDPYINRCAIQILQTSNTPQYDPMAAARAIYEWVRRNIRYVPDPVEKETVRPANVILKVGAGDCDDINGVLIPSLLGTIGISSRGVTVAAAPESDDFSHIYAEALIGSQWVPMDAARPQVVFGQAPEMWKRRAEWPITGTEVGQGGYLAGMAALGDDTTDATAFITAIGTNTANLIRAIDPSTGLPPVGMVLTPSGTYASVSSSGASLGTNVSGTEIIIGLGLIAVVFMAMRR